MASNGRHVWERLDVTSRRVFDHRKRKQASNSTEIIDCFNLCEVKAVSSHLPVSSLSVRTLHMLDGSSVSCSLTDPQLA